MLSTLRRDDRGQIATLFALAAIPLIAFTGIAIDYTRASLARDQLQQALDAASIVAARATQQRRSASQVQDAAREFMDANLQSDWWSGYNLDSITVSNGVVDLAASGSVPTTLARIVGVNELDFNTTSQVTWGTGRLEVALVLDNTGSMNERGKMTELKRAARALLDAIQSSDPDLVKVGIVPYNQSIKLDTASRNESWLEFRPECSSRDRRRDRCREASASDIVEKDDWHGCVADRGENPPTRDVSGRNYDTNDVQGSDDELRYPAVECYSDSLPEILALTTNLGSARNKVNQLVPIGGTNITIGMAWGITLLSDQAPFTQGSPWNTQDVSKVIVLMTDGENCNNRWISLSAAQCSSWFYASQRDGIDSRTQLACDRAKQRGIIVYTVRLLDGNAGLLRDCATDPNEYYFDVKNVEDLVPAFRAIGDRLTKMHLSA